MPVLAFDYGASGGRAIAYEIINGKLVEREMHRFDNSPVFINGEFKWDILRLFHEMKKGIEACVKSDVKIDGIGVDTWGVDYALIDKSGRLITNPYQYRDKRTAPLFKNPPLPKTEQYAESGIADQPFNTYYQIAADEYYQKCEKAIFLPDYFGYLLTGKMVSEYSMASTSALLAGKTRKFSARLFKVIGKKNKFPPLVKAPAVLGYVSADIKEELGLTYDIPVITVLGHDTASAIFSLPTSDEDIAYISSGTWSLMGTLLKNPEISAEAQKHNFTNELGYNNRVRFLKNIMGLWIIQQCRKQWLKTQPDLSYAEIQERAAAAPPTPEEWFIDVNAEAFYAPYDMTKAINDYLTAKGVKRLPDMAETARLVFESLAREYASVLKTLRALTGKKLNKLHIIGGGCRNSLLNRLTAKACGVEVIAGPGECTAYGNALCQFLALGVLKDERDCKRLLKNSVELERFLPE